MPEIIPNWHPILVNFTVALLAMATLLFGVSAIWRGRRWSPGLESAANWNLWLGAAVTTLTIAAGLYAAQTVAHDEAAHADHETGRETPAAASELSPAESEVVAALTAYHDALTAGNPTAPEPYVLTDARFLMIEGKHVNQGWADYRDNHLKPELADLAKVRFRLSGYRIQMNDGLAAVSFSFSILPKTGPERDFGSGRGTAVLVRTDSGWKLQQLHTS